MGVCSQAMNDAASLDDKLSCSVDSGYSFHVISAVPTADQIPKICASSTCQKVIAAMKSAQPTECNTGGPMWNFQMYAQIFNPIAAKCGQGSSPASPPANPPAPPPTAPPPTAPPPTAAPPPPTTAAPPPPATTPAPPPTSPSNGGGSSPQSSTPTSGPSTEGATATPSPSTSVGSNGTSTWTPPAGTVGSSITPSQNSTNANNNAKTESSSGINSTVIIAIVAGVVVVIALVAFLAFRAGKRRNDGESPREPSYVVQNDHRAVAAKPKTTSNYVPSPVTNGTVSSATRSSMPVTRSSNAQQRSPAYYSNASGAGGSGETAAAGASGLWNDSAIKKARIPLEDISVGDLLSAGAFGEVLRGSFNGAPVAIKRLLPARRKDMKEIDSFLEEAKLLTSLRHQRIVQFVGVAWDSLTDLCIVTEFMDGGDLRSLLQHADANNEPTGFDANKVKIALHIIHALSYLHGLKPIVVHRDLKSKNVLLTRDLDAKLTDFGVSRERAEKTMTAGVGSSLWMAPEVMLGERYDEKADIFSFGVMLSELDTQKLPYAHAKEPGSERQIPEMAMLNMVSAGRLSVAFTEGADPDMVATGQACVALDPKDRPTANEVFTRMHHIYRGYRHV